MKRIEVLCATCGPVPAVVEECVVLRCEQTGTYTMTFECPVCFVRGAHRCDRGTVLELVAGGAPLRPLVVPDEVHDPVRWSASAEARAQMYAMLENRAWLERLVELG